MRARFIDNDTVEIDDIQFHVVRESGRIGLVYRETLMLMIERVNNRTLRHPVVVQSVVKTECKWYSATRSHEIDGLCGVIIVESIELKTPRPSNAGDALTMQNRINRFVADMNRK